MIRFIFLFLFIFSIFSCTKERKQMPKSPCAGIQKSPCEHFSVNNWDMKILS